MTVVLITGLLIGIIGLDWYLFGIAVFIVICRLIRNIGYLSYVGSKLFSYNYFEFIKEVYALPFLAFIVTAVAGYIIKVYCRPVHIVLLGVEVVAVLAIYVLICWRYVLKFETKTAIKSLIPSY